MPFAKLLLSVTAAVLCLLLVASPRVESQDDEKENDALESLRRNTPSGQYVDLANFFRFHGYITLSDAESKEELGIGEDAPQILIGGPEGGVKNDAALFVGGEPFEGVGSVIEIHFVGDATDPVITEDGSQITL